MFISIIINLNGNVYSSLNLKNIIVINIEVIIETEFAIISIDSSTTISGAWQPKRIKNLLIYLNIIYLYYFSNNYLIIKLFLLEYFIIYKYYN